MKSTLNRKPAADALLVKIGGWFEASATGWGIVALVVVLVVLLVADAIR